MKFNTIEDNVYSVEIIQHKMNQLYVELGVRDDNEHVGTGLGGNNFQLLCLLSIKHTLCHQRKPMILKDGVIYWDALWLLTADLLMIRYELSRFFLELDEKYKYQGLIALSLPKSKDLGIQVDKYSDQFPNLFSNYSQLGRAYTICNELAKGLDSGDDSLIQSVGAELLNFEPEVILMSIRIYIQIDRLVCHNLDEAPVFAQCLNKVQNLVD